MVFALLHPSPSYKEFFSFWNLPFPFHVIQVDFSANGPTSFLTSGLETEANLPDQRTHSWTHHDCSRKSLLLSNRAKQMVTDELVIKKKKSLVHLAWFPNS